MDSGGNLKKKKLKKLRENKTSIFSKHSTLTYSSLETYQGQNITNNIARSIKIMIVICVRVFFLFEQRQGERHRMRGGMVRGLLLSSGLFLSFASYGIKISQSCFHSAECLSFSHLDKRKGKGLLSVCTKRTLRE